MKYANLGYSKFNFNYINDSIESRTQIERAICQSKYFKTHGIINLLANQDFWIVGKTPLISSGKYINLKMPKVKSDVAGVKIYGYTGTVFTPDTGTLVTPLNLNFKNPIASQWQEVRIGATITDNGTPFYYDYIAGTSSGPFADAGTTEQEDFFIFENNTNYMLYVENVDSANTILFEINHIECDL